MLFSKGPTIGGMYKLRERRDVKRDLNDPKHTPIIQEAAGH